MSKHIVIVGGVAGGASAAARLRRLSEKAKITIIERGAHVSFANCGLPYHIGDEIKERKSLLLHSADSLAKRFKLNVRTKTTATAIHPENKTIDLLGENGQEETLSYDELILSTGASPLKPPMPGVDALGVFTLRDIADMDTIISWLDKHKPSRVTVAGGGFIGVEVAEQLVEKVKEVILIEGKGHVIAPFDQEMAKPLNEELRKHLTLRTGNRLKSIEKQNDGQVSAIFLDDDSRIECDMLILGLGVRPDTELAKESGIEIGITGGIKVNQFLQTSKNNIWAIGDVIEVKNFITGQAALIALAGPANRQGRLVADNIILADKKPYKGTLGTAIVRIFTKTAACTGINERSAKENNIEYKKIYLFPASHAGYFPGAKTINMKVLFNPSTRKILGAQAVGEDGVDKRIDVIATAIKGGLSIDDLADLELCYAPPFGSAKDPVNMAGMMAQNISNGLVDMVGPDQINGFILDVRSDSEVSKGKIPGATHIALDQLRDRLTELPVDKKIFVYCKSGQRSYNATRILIQNGFDAINVSGAYDAYNLFN